MMTTYLSVIVFCVTTLVCLDAVPIQTTPYPSNKESIKSIKDGFQGLPPDGQLKNLDLNVAVHGNIKTKLGVKGDGQMKPVDHGIVKSESGAIEISPVKLAEQGTVKTNIRPKEVILVNKADNQAVETNLGPKKASPIQPEKITIKKTTSLQSPKTEYYKFGPGYSSWSHIDPRTAFNPDLEHQQYLSNSYETALMQYMLNSPFWRAMLRYQGYYPSYDWIWDAPKPEIKYPFRPSIVDPRTEESFLKQITGTARAPEIRHRYRAGIVDPRTDGIPNMNGPELLPVDQSFSSGARSDFGTSFQSSIVDPRTVQ